MQANNFISALQRFAHWRPQMPVVIVDVDGKSYEVESIDKERDASYQQTLKLTIKEKS